MRIKEEALKPGALHELRQKIYDEISPDLRSGLHALWVDVPGGPNIDEDAQHCLIDFGGPDPETLASIFPSDDWLKSYEANRFRIHIFYAAEEDQLAAAAAAAAKVLGADFGIELNDRAWREAKLDRP